MNKTKVICIENENYKLIQKLTGNRGTQENEIVELKKKLEHTMHNTGSF